MGGKNKGHVGPVNHILLRVEAKRQGYTHKALAEKLGVSSSTVSQWMMGGVSPSLDNFKNLCELLDMHPLHMQMASHDIRDLARHERVMSFYAAELKGENDAPRYDEVRLIEADIDGENIRGTEEDEVKQGEFTIFDTPETAATPEPDAPESDEEQD